MPSPSAIDNRLNRATIRYGNLLLRTSRDRGLTDKELVEAYKQATKKSQPPTQDIEDRISAILTEMEARGMEHP